MSNTDKGTVEEIQASSGLDYENWNSGGPMPFDLPCKTTHLVNATLLAHGEKNGLLSWLWATDLFIQWTPVHHISLQISQLFLLILFLLPNLKGYHRFLGLCYGASMFTFGYFVLRSLDLITWSALIILVNGIYLISSMCRVAGCTRSHSKELEVVYKQMFQKLHITRDQFNTILSCKKNTRILAPNSPYAIEKTTRVDSLGLLLSGKLLVSQQGRPLHIILPFQFVDSPEYFGVSTDELFQVSITAVEESKVLIWHRDKLRLTIMSDEFLSIMFDHIIGRDVVRKLIQVSDTVTLPSNNGVFIPGSKESSEESDPMLETNNKDMSVVYGGGGEGGGGHGPQRAISTFDTDLPRIKYFANEVWSLTKIDEEMVQV